MLIIVFKRLLLFIYLIHSWIGWHSWDTLFFNPIKKWCIRTNVWSFLFWLSFIIILPCLTLTLLHTLFKSFCKLCITVVCHLSCPWFARERGWGKKPSIIIFAKEQAVLWFFLWNFQPWWSESAANMRYVLVDCSLS